MARAGPLAVRCAVSAGGLGGGMGRPRAGVEGRVTLQARRRRDGAARNILARGAVCQWPRAACAPRLFMPHRSYTLADFDFELPPELIAQQPAAERSASRLLDGRGPRAGRPGVPRTARSAAAGRPAGLQRHAGHQGAAVRREVQRRRGAGAGRAGAARPRGAGPPARQQVAQGRQHAALCRRLRRRGAGPRRAGRGAVPPALSGRPLRAAAGARPCAAAAVHHARATRPEDEARYQTVFAARPGRGGRADRGAALRRGAAAGAGRARRAPRRA